MTEAQDPRAYFREQARQQRMDDVHVEMEEAARAFIFERDLAKARLHTRTALTILDELLVPHPEGEA